MLLASAGFARQVVETASQTPPTATARIEPGALTFPAEAVGSQSPPQTITLTDSGNADLQITDILISGIDFAQANSCGDRLSPGASCSINVTCKPAILGQRLGTISTSPPIPAVLDCFRSPEPGADWGLLGLRQRTSLTKGTFSAV